LSLPERRRLYLLILASSCLSVSLSLCLSACKMSRAPKRIFRKLCIAEFYWNSFGRLQFCSKSDHLNQHFTWWLNALRRVTREIFIGAKHVWIQSCRGKRNTQLVPSAVFPLVLQFSV
jgi:hypothetical protein